MWNMINGSMSIVHIMCKILSIGNTVYTQEEVTLTAYLDNLFMGSLSMSTIDQFQVRKVPY